MYNSEAVKYKNQLHRNTVTSPLPTAVSGRAPPAA
jgi:hypothetical protein